MKIRSWRLMKYVRNLRAAFSIRCHCGLVAMGVVLDLRSKFFARCTVEVSLGHAICAWMLGWEPNERSRTITDRFQRVLIAAAWVVSGTRKFDRGLSQLLHSELLHWLDIPQRVQYKLGITVHRCLQNEAPQYLMDYCTRSSDVSSHQRLRSANRHQLMVPRHRRGTFGRRAFSIAGPMEWNSLSHSLRDPVRSTDGFKSALKTLCFCLQKMISALEALRDALYKSTTTTTCTTTVLPTTTTTITTTTTTTTTTTINAVLTLHQLCWCDECCCHYAKPSTTYPSCARRSPKSPNDSTFVRPAAACSSCKQYSSIRTAVVRSP